MSSPDQDSTMPQLQPPLDEYRRQIDACKDELRQLVEGLSSDQLNWSPAPGKWSIVQCLDHLNITDREYFASTGAAIERSWNRGVTGGGRMRYGPFERWFIRSLEPPPKRRFKALRRISPPLQLEPTSVIEEFLELKDRLIDLLYRANGLDLTRAKMRSPFLKILNFRLGAVFAIVVAHERRHLWQARQVRRHPDFPR